MSTESARIAPQTMRVTVTVEFDHHTLGRVQLSKESRSAVGHLRDMPATAERLHGESTALVLAQLKALTSSAEAIPHASD